MPLSTYGQRDARPQIDNPAHTPDDTPMRYPKPYHDCVAIQRLIMKRVADERIEDKILAAIARAFCDLEETKRKLKMKPLPKPVDVESPAQARRRRQSTAEPLATE